MPIAIKDILLFKSLSSSELSSIQACLREKSYDKGEILFSEGELCQRVFIVKEGRVKLYRIASSGREQILETLNPGDTCACNPGSVAWSCSSTAEAATPCTVWYISRDTYVSMVQKNPTFAHALNRLFAERLRCFSSLIEEVSLKDVKKRLVKFLLDIEGSKSAKLQSKETISVPFTQEEMAQRLGTARETIARHLSELKQEGFIDIKPKQVVIRNKSALEKLLS